MKAATNSGGNTTDSRALKSSIPHTPSCPTILFLQIRVTHRARAQNAAYLDSAAGSGCATETARPA